MVVKIPEARFPKGRDQSRNREALTAVTHLFKIVFVISAEYCTEFDCVSAILNNKPIFACRLLHGERHGESPNTAKSAKVAVVTHANFEVPRGIASPGHCRSQTIGDGLYASTLKKLTPRLVIEADEQPSIDRGVKTNISATTFTWICRSFWVDAENAVDTRVKSVNVSITKGDPPVAFLALSSSS